MKPYVVRRGKPGSRFGCDFLRLNGPFQYPSWTGDIDRATPMTKARAFWWSALEGGVPWNPELPEPVPETQRTAQVYESKDVTCSIGGMAFGLGDVNYDDD